LNPCFTGSQIIFEESASHDNKHFPIIRLFLRK
jgi:hypothetical protein